MACADDNSSFREEPADSSGKELKLQASIEQVNVSRANDSGFADGDRIGVYAVNFTTAGNPGQLSATTNLATNVCFKYNESTLSWTGDRQIYFQDDKTPIDVYGYYPYSKTVTDVKAHPISVQRNQATDASDGNLSGYEASDFLWAKSIAVLPSSQMVWLTFRHILAAVQVTLIEGAGFEEGEWARLDKSVLVSNTKLNATVDLSTGTATLLDGSNSDAIITNPSKKDYRAIVIPQTVESSKTLLAITIDGHTYEFKKNTEMTYVSSKMHKFTIEVSKAEEKGDYEFSLLDEAITAWESDLTSHNGQIKEYIVVNTPKFGGLESVITELKLNPAEIINLKLTGQMNGDDFKYLRTNMTNLEAINIQDVIVNDNRIIGNRLPQLAFCNMPTLKSCVLPKKLEAIDAYAFCGTSLSGSLEIPEGVISIGNSAFSNNFEGSSVIPGFHILHHNNLTGTLTLPSTLKYIGADAFNRCDFSGDLLLPEGLIGIGESAFANCKHFTGDLHIPESVEKIGLEAFDGMTGIKGWITLPSNLKTIAGLGYLNPAGIEWPKNAQTIDSRAFYNFNSSIDLKIPESVVSLKNSCFRNANITHIILSPQLTLIPSDCFAGCTELSDTLKIPEQVEVIANNAFLGCNKIEALSLPSKLIRIEEYAFASCHNLNYIHCNAIQPPTLSESAFWGIAQDNFTVEVPEQSVEAYRNAPGWREFKRISAYRNFVARPSKYDVLNKGGRREITLNADADWEMTSCPSWCHIDKTSGSKKTTLTLMVDAMAKGASDRTGKITFKLKDKEEHLTHINVAQYDYEYDEDQYLTLQSATKGKGINLAFIGDGYDAVDIASGKYLEDMKREMEYFFGVEPYTTYRDYFNVYTAFALSEDSGVENINRWRNTKFKVTTGDGCSKDGQRLSADWMSALDYCAQIITPTVNRADPSVGCILVSNTDIYEGITYSIGNSFCAVVTLSEAAYPYDARGLVQHEAGGHGLGWLADEYIYHSAFIQKCGCSCCGHVEELTANHASGFGLNVSLNGKYKEVPWSHLIFNPNYGDIVDIYEGGYFHNRGVYRSEYNSCMNHNVPYFSTWSRQLIVQRIMKLAGEEFSLEKFYANDSRALGPDFTSTARSGATEVSAPRRHGNAPVFIKNYKFGKKGGRR
ncbi:MAG: leucine-rich repeat protein [Staphylococcus sp.]|nr:leucine-rich repeat protein [Staphylococcus sp.]